jgi:hypothetical protein
LHAAMRKVIAVLDVLGTGRDGRAGCRRGVDGARRTSGRSGNENHDL